MICSEFVYRSYDEAMSGIEDPFSLRIGPFMAGVWPAAAFMAPGTGPQATSRGEGIHPQSLLAFLSTESSDAWLTGTAGPALVVDSTGHPEVDTAELEETITAYPQREHEESRPLLWPRRRSSRWRSCAPPLIGLPRNCMRQGRTPPAQNSVSRACSRPRRPPTST